MKKFKRFYVLMKLFLLLLKEWLVCAFVCIDVNCEFKHGFWQEWKKLKLVINEIDRGESDES